jgi:hypothetical protein
VEDYLDELKRDTERVIAKIYGSASDLVLMGSDIQKIEFFEEFRKLLTEKELANDRVAVEVLSWAYDRLADSCD